MLCSDRALSHPQAKTQKRERQRARVLSNSGKSEHMLDGDREKRSSVLFQDGESDAQRHGEDRVCSVKMEGEGKSLPGHCLWGNI